MKFNNILVVLNPDNEKQYALARAVRLVKEQQNETKVKITTLLSVYDLSYEMSALLSSEERLAAFIHNLSKRYSARGFSAKEFRLTMTRSDIGNYLGLTVETISRLLGRFQKLGVLSVQGKYITINDINALIDLTGVHKTKIQLAE